MIKLYVNQTTEKTVDGDQLQVVDVLPSVTVKKVMGGASGIPNVIEINGEDYIRRPK